MNAREWRARRYLVLQVTLALVVAVVAIAVMWPR
jgi:hypothetical protein